MKQLLLIILLCFGFNCYSQKILSEKADQVLLKSQLEFIKIQRDKLKEFIKTFDNETYKNTRRSAWLLNEFLSYVENVQYLEKRIKSLEKIFVGKGKKRFN